jgi:hypothetical protein
MDASKGLAGLSLAVALTAFGMTGMLAIRARVEPLYAVLRSIVAFVGVLCLARWSTSVVESLGSGRPPSRPDRDGSSGGGDERTQRR